MVDVGADPIHAVAAQLTVAAPFARAVQTRIAALLADQGALGAHAAAGTVSVGAVGADPTVRTDIIPAFSAMFTAFRADLRTIRAAFVADADGHAVAASAIASRAVLAASAFFAELIPVDATALGTCGADIGTLCTASLAETDGRTVSADIAVVAPAVIFHAGEAQAAELAKPFAAVLTAYPAALADLGAVFAACPAVSADVSRANTAQAVTAVVFFVAVASAFCRAVVAAFSAVCIRFGCISLGCLLQMCGASVPLGVMKLRGSSNPHSPVLPSFRWGALSADCSPVCGHRSERSQRQKGTDKACSF